MTTREILIVDDDLTALDIIDFLFEQEGFVVSRCSDGESALEAVGQSTPSVILIDLMMPGLSGQETVVKLREQGLSVPIIAFTALEDADSHNEALEAGCNLVLTKPCKPKDLLAKVQEVLGS